MSDVNISIGELRTRITFQEPTIGKDGGGAQKPTFTNVATTPTVWARWVNAHGQETVQNAVKSIQRATVTIRFREDVLPTWQILKDGDAWQIISVDHVQDRRRWIEMVVERSKGTI